jgi:hypothetical protein
MFGGDVWEDVVGERRPSNVAQTKHVLQMLDLAPFWDALGMRALILSRNFRFLPVKFFL